VTTTHPVGQMTAPWCSKVYNSHTYGWQNHTKCQLIFNLFCCITHTFLTMLLSFYPKKLAILEQPIVTEFYKYFNFVLKTLKLLQLVNHSVYPEHTNIPFESILCSVYASLLYKFIKLPQKHIGGPSQIFKLPNSTKTKGYIHKGQY
jgi:hypothetical protein